MRAFALWALGGGNHFRDSDCRTFWIFPVFSCGTDSCSLQIPFGPVKTVVPESGSQKVQHDLHAISLKIEASLLTIDGPPENSTDLERAAAARLIDEEFSGGPHVDHQ